MTQWRRTLMDCQDRKSVHCPTCRAAQEWSDTCRRCKCDLRLLRALSASYQNSRTRCLLALRARRPAEALRWARRCWELCADAESRRLVALCALVVGDWPTALAFGRDTLA
jgi:hypothetical protein